MKKKIPTIKGVFVKSHINNIRILKGENGIKELEKRYGKSLVFANTDDVPVRDEVKLIECAVMILSDNPLTANQIAYEAGRLHFNNFRTTPFARIILPFFKSKFKLMMLQAQNIAGHVFRGVEFHSVDLGNNAVKVTMRNNDYPLDHFRGLFQEWMNYSELNGKVTAIRRKGVYEYTMKWN